ncbi:unnamed protein product, partial [marine sediment metagenome]
LFSEDFLFRMNCPCPTVPVAYPTDTPKLELVPTIELVAPKEERKPNILEVPNE